MDDFFRYRIYKRNISVITLGKEEDEKHFTCVNDSLHGQCQERYSLRYINETYVSFRLSNITFLDSGLYRLEAFFAGIIRDPEYAEMYLTVQGNPFFYVNVPVIISLLGGYITDLETCSSDGAGLMVSALPPDGTVWI